jgi:hypothetical protein
VILVPRSSVTGGFLTGSTVVRYRVRQTSLEGGDEMGEKIHGNPENRPQTTKEEKPRQKVDVVKALGAAAVKNANGQVGRTIPIVRVARWT